jgi:hypothetical protein
MTDDRMTDADAFRALHFAAMTLATRLIGSLERAQVETLDRAAKAGARMELVLDLPDGRACTLWLIEREGTRHRLGSFDAIEPLAH